MLAALAAIGVLFLVVVVVSFVGMEDEPKTDPAVERCIDELQSIADRTGVAAGDLRAACERTQRPQIAPSYSTPAIPDPTSDPGGYAEWFCRSTLRSDGLEKMAADLQTTPTPEAVAKAYAEGVTARIQTETEDGCLRGLQPS